jgi:hypothetical protein
MEWSLLQVLSFQFTFCTYAVSYATHATYFLGGAEGVESTTGTQSTFCAADTYSVYFLYVCCRIRYACYPLSVQLTGDELLLAGAKVQIVTPLGWIRGLGRTAVDVG